MRRFPPPPTGRGVEDSSPSFQSSITTPSSKLDLRSKEAPMQFEWESPRRFPSSPFLSRFGGGTSTVEAQNDEEGARARKRTHYEAMDVDTPPRGDSGSSSSVVDPTRPSRSPAPPPFPHSATIPPVDEFHFHDLHEGSTFKTPTETLPQPMKPFIASEFSAKAAFGLDPEQMDDHSQFNTGASSSSSLVTTAGTAQPSRARRRRDRPNYSPERRGEAPSGSRNKQERNSRSDDDEEDDDDTTNERRAAATGTLGRNRGFGDSAFSFQVHHHHADDLDGRRRTNGSLAYSQPQSEERWLNRKTPYILLGYLQLSALTLLSALVLFITCLFLYTLYTDITARLASLTIELRSEIMQCAKAYVDNRCEPSTRIPAMERKCSGWEECMAREVVVVGKTRVVAETLAEVVNGFVEVISFKTMLFVMLSLGVTLYGSSVALSILPARTGSAHQMMNEVAYNPRHNPMVSAPAAALGYHPYPFAPSPSGQGYPSLTQSLHRESYPEWFSSLKNGVPTYSETLGEQRRPSAAEEQSKRK